MSKNILSKLMKSKSLDATTVAGKMGSCLSSVYRWRGLKKLPKKVEEKIKKVFKVRG
jgi:hypothetical protein